MEGNFGEGELKKEKIEPGIVAEFYTSEGRKRRIVRSIALSTKPGAQGERHLIESAYEEVKRDVWQKVYGSEKDLGIA